MLEGIILALQNACALDHVVKLAPTFSKEQIPCGNLSGSDGKDVEQVMLLLV
jgi:tryptophan synthase beta chain